MKATFGKDVTSNCQIFFEHYVYCNGWTFLLIYGRHINGGFICIPNWNICCEASTFRKACEYHTNNLVEAGMNYDTARLLAMYIDDYRETHDCPLD